MAIEINNVPGNQIGSVGAGGQTQGGQEQATDKAADATRGAGNARDQVSLTPQAQQLQDLANRVSDLPEVDTQRVNAVKDAIANGSFEVSPDRIAEKLVSLERSLNDLS